MKTSVFLIGFMFASASKGLPRQPEVSAEAVPTTPGMDIGVRRLLEALRHESPSPEKKSNFQDRKHEPDFASNHANDRTTSEYQRVLAQAALAGILA